MTSDIKSALSAFDSVEKLKKVGPEVAKRLARLNIKTLQDMLFHLPMRYQDRTRLVPIGSLQPGKEVLIEGEIEHSEVAYRGRRTLLCKIADGTGLLTLRFFYFSKTQQANLVRGAKLRCFGEVRLNRRELEIIHPEYRHISSNMPTSVDENLTPVYPATEGVQQLSLRQLTDQVLELLKERKLLEEYLPPSILEKNKFPDLIDALLYVHRPPPDADLHKLREGKHPAQKRLIFEEMLAHHLSMRRLRQQAQKDRAMSIQVPGVLQNRCKEQLPFQLTNAQQRVIREIHEDLYKPYPAMRLIQGDVGSGKTLVACMAILNVIEAGYQAAIMAPTELLAEQHYQNFLQWLEPLGIKTGWFSSRLKGKQKESTLAMLQAGEIQLAIGTHALFQEDIVFKDLALIVVDEQHRFGVHQRLALWEKGVTAGYHPHQITMTATPIPRTLAMTAYADLDYSVIDELPPGRKPVKTVVLSDKRRNDVINRIEKACANGSQAYWVCTLIEESEALQCQAAEDAANDLAEILPNIKVGLVHGRLKPVEKQAIMNAFKEGEIQLLVATTVIEVGVDVPNATLMIIENSERLGLAQLHQLRGRVGRGAAESNCVLMYRAPLSEKARTRLNVMREHSDGFEIAKHDLQIRGPGEVLGTRQTGVVDFKIADIMRDAEILPDIQKAAGQIQQPELITALINRWLGDKQQFQRV